MVAHDLKFVIPYELEEIPPTIVMVGKRVVVLSKGWRLRRDADTGSV